jgi:hypothetical protein
MGSEVINNIRVSNHHSKNTNHTQAVVKEAFSFSSLGMINNVKCNSHEMEGPTTKDI